MLQRKEMASLHYLSRGDGRQMTEQEKLIQSLLDREAIRDLPRRYCHCVWQADIDGFVALFTEGATFESVGSSGSSYRATGHDDLRSMIDDALRRLELKPFIHNHIVDMRGSSEAVGVCYVEARYRRKDKMWSLTGWYEDEYLKVQGSWKIQNRRFVLVSRQAV